MTLNCFCFAQTTCERKALGHNRRPQSPSVPPSGSLFSMTHTYPRQFTIVSRISENCYNRFKQRKKLLFGTQRKQEETLASHSLIENKRIFTKTSIEAPLVGFRPITFV